MCIPAPTVDDKPFKISDVHTIYEAAMIYAGRHPYPHFFAVKDSDIKEHLEFLKLGVSEASPSKRPRARRSWDIHCELVKRIEQGRIQRVKLAYDQQGKIDPCRTQIRTLDLAGLATDRGEKPRYLRPLLAERNADKNPATQTTFVATLAKPDFRHIETEYERRINDLLHAQQRYPNRKEDMEWGKSKFRLKRCDVRELRNKYIPAEVRKGGRPKARKLGKK
jgi:hypothetical protein